MGSLLPNTLVWFLCFIGRDGLSIKEEKAVSTLRVNGACEGRTAIGFGAEMGPLGC